MKYYRQMENDRDSLLAKKWRFLDMDSLDEYNNATRYVIFNYDKTIKVKDDEQEYIISFAKFKNIYKELIDIEEMIDQDKLDKAYNELYRLREESKKDRGVY